MLTLTYLTIATTVFLQTTTPDSTKYETRFDHDPNGIGKFYLGREIAYVMTHEGAGWLDRRERDKEENPQKLVKALGLKKDEVVVDLGAGSGYYSLMMAPMVAKVIAVDIQPEMLAIIDRKAKGSKISNIELLLAKEQDPGLKPSSVDTILLVDVYHELAYPREVTRKMIEALKPGGRIVLVEFRLEDPEVPIKLVHKMSEKQVLREMKEFPELKPEPTIGILPWQHVITVRKNRKD
ncbi:MAG: class I SAM-dependent methyltransferase [Planctomycetota bacterium]|jgi:ubiquinone/menaquinone biosynthesis C-methylase UbiE